MSRKLIPITRSNRFFSESEFRLEDKMGREWLEGDNNMKIVLFRVDINKTQVDDLYNESNMDDIKYLPAVEVNVLPILNKPDNKTYNEGNGSLRYLQDGQLTFIVYSSHLTELGVNINYGDYIGYSVNESTMRYFSVVNDGLKNYDNNHTILGFKSFYRTITCASVDPSEFSGV
jgi:hypothetical protein